MAAAKRRRRLPTLVNRGLGLIEVILPRGISEDVVSPLPEGRRDDSGFWYPTGYDQPGDIFTPQQRRLQAKQRAIQKSRRRPEASAVPSTGDAGRQARETAGQGRGSPDQAADAGKPASGEVKASARDPAGAPASVATGSAIAAIVTGGFGLREVAIPLPPACRESAAAIAAGGRHDRALPPGGTVASAGNGVKTLASSGVRCVDSIIPSE
jgi:hypothetical protein